MKDILKNLFLNTIKGGLGGFLFSVAIYLFCIWGISQGIRPAPGFSERMSKLYYGMIIYGAIVGFGCTRPVQLNKMVSILFSVGLIFFTIGVAVYLTNIFFREPDTIVFVWTSGIVAGVFTVMSHLIYFSEKKNAALT